jgi:hypothetical protein
MTVPSLSHPCFRVYNYLITSLQTIWGGGGGVQLGPFSTAATNRPIVSSLGDYNDGEISGMMIGGRN